MKRAKAKKRICELRDEIRHHDYLYYVRNQPEISDEEFDEIFRKLEELEAAFPDLITDNSPIQGVGGEPLESFPQIEHSRPLLRLESSAERSDLERFHQRILE